MGQTLHGSVKTTHAVRAGDRCATDSHPGRIQCMQAMTAGWTEARVGVFAKLHRSSRTQKPMFWLSPAKESGIFADGNLRRDK